MQRTVSCFNRRAHRRMIGFLRSAVWLGVLWQGSVGGAALADTPVNAFDPAIGADPRHYPPDCPVDFRHLRLELTFDDLTSRSFTGVASLTVTPVNGNVTALTLDAVDLDIKQVDATGGVALRWDYDGKKLALLFDHPLPQDKLTTINIRYRCVEPIDGMTWALPDEAYPHRPLVIHTQGEPTFARYWFPCLDSPVDRCTTEVEVTIPSPFFALSNGKLVDRKDSSDGKRTTFHYRQEQPHVFYLVTLVIGKFNEVKDTWRGIDVQYFLPEGSGEAARLSYGKTPDMLEYFSNKLAFPYPYAKYAQVTVPLFSFGGMENTSATTMGDTAILTPHAAIDQDLEGLISHELAHQWFGDLITCRSWEHLWLNEGFATFMGSVWKERSKGREEYLYDFWKRFPRIAANDRTDDGPGILFKEYRHPNEVFRFKGSMPYIKGSCVLHMLRHQLGETIFWNGLRSYVAAHAYQQVETNDLRRSFEVASGRNLERFFDQWVSRPGIVNLEVTYRWDAASHTAVVRVVQTQPITRDTPAFHAPLDLYFASGDEVFTKTIDLTQRSETYRHEFDMKPDLFCVDPEAGLLAKIKTEKPRAMWLNQLRRGPTTIARANAALSLSRDARPEVVDALRSVVETDQEHWTVRGEAASALGAMNNARGRDALLVLLGKRKTLDNSRVRAAVIQAAGSYDTREIGAALVPFAKSDPSERVEAAATRALGKIRSFDAQAVLVANAAKESFQGSIRLAAISALARRNDPRAIDIAMQYAAYGNADRMRPTAIRALGRLARQNPTRRDALRATIANWLTDPQDRSIVAAIGALADMGDAASQAALRKAMRGAMKETQRNAAADALARARGETESDRLRALREEMRELREQVGALRARTKERQPVIDQAR